MQPKEDKEGKRQPYEKPEVKVIELKALELRTIIRQISDHYVQ